MPKNTIEPRFEALECFTGAAGTLEEAFTTAAGQARLTREGQQFAVQIHVTLVDDPVIDEYRVVLTPTSAG